MGMEMRQKRQKRRARRKKSGSIPTARWAREIFTLFGGSKLGSPLLFGFCG